MAMTKKERAEFDAAIERAELLAALRWTNPVEPDVPVPGWGEPASIGFMQNAYSIRVDKGWSTSVSHGMGDYDERGSGSQRGQRLYSTAARAWSAMRHEVEMRAARDLLKIDRLIAASETDQK